MVSPFFPSLVPRYVDEHWFSFETPHDEDEALQSLEKDFNNLMREIENSNQTLSEGVNGDGTGPDGALGGNGNVSESEEIDEDGEDDDDDDDEDDDDEDNEEEDDFEEDVTFPFNDAEF